MSHNDKREQPWRDFWPIGLEFPGHKDGLYKLDL